MGLLGDAIRRNETKIQEVLQVGYAVWDDLVDRVERQEGSVKSDFNDEQIWTFLVGCGYALPDSGPTQLCGKLLGRTGDKVSQIWFEALPVAPRLKEGSSHIDLAVGGIRRRAGTRAGIEYAPSLASWVALCECKWYSDISTKVSYDQHRNQLLRVIENALLFQSADGRPEHVDVVLVTPQRFKDRTIKSRLYQYKFEEYFANPSRVVEELKACCLAPSCLNSDIETRLSSLRLHWVSYQDLFFSMSDSELRNLLLEFVEKYDASGSHV